MTTITLDIETLPTDRADVIEMLAEQIKPPATYKKPESIAQWLEENKVTELDTLHRKTALDGSFGRICCIGFAIDDEPAQTYHSQTGNEFAVLTNFAEHLNNLHCDKFNTVFVGHNLASFDLRFLVQRYIVNNFPVPFLLKHAASAKPWESDKVFDTMVQWAGVGGKISLEKLCMALEIPSPKGEITGATVYDEFLKGNIQGIADYCIKDVESTRAVYKRMRGN